MGMNIYFFSLDFVKWKKNHPRVALRAFRKRSIEEECNTGSLSKDGEKIHSYVDL